MSDSLDTLLPSAPQLTADTILGPCAIGWSLQLLFCGMATALAGTLLLSKASRVGRYTKPLLIASVLFNLAGAGINAAEIWQYMLSQHRDSDTLNSYTLADALAPLPAGLTASACQIYMGLRCIKIAGKTIWLPILMTVGIAASLAGAVWLTVVNMLYRADRATPDSLLAPTELWMWAAVGTDLTLTLILSYSLRKLRRGFNKSTDDFISSLIQLAFGTCAAPLVFELFTAISYASTAQTSLLWNLFNATAPAIPSLYVISFCYCLRASASKLSKLDHSSYKLQTGSRGPSSSAPYIMRSLDQNVPIAEMTKSDEERLRSKRRAREPNMLERAFTKEDRPAMLRRATSETAIANSRSNFMKPSGGLRTNNTSGDGETFKLHFTVSESRTSSYLDASDRASDLSKDGHENSTSTLDRLDFRPEPRQAQSGLSVPTGFPYKGLLPRYHSPSPIIEVPSPIPDVPRGGSWSTLPQSHLQDSAQAADLQRPSNEPDFEGSGPVAATPRIMQDGVCSGQHSYTAPQLTHVRRPSSESAGLRSASHHVNSRVGAGVTSSMMSPSSSAASSISPSSTAPRRSGSAANIQSGITVIRYPKQDQKDEASSSDPATEGDLTSLPAAWAESPAQVVTPPIPTRGRFNSLTSGVLIKVETQVTVDE